MKFFSDDWRLIKKEIIDGLTVVHTGKFKYGFKALFEELEIYDKDGNRFYSNAETLEKAQEYIAKLAEEGITAVIGPAAPGHGRDGKLRPNKSETRVGVFIVNQLEKEQGYTDETPKKHR